MLHLIQELAAGLPSLPSLDDATITKLENAPAMSSVRRAPKEEATPVPAAAPTAAGAPATALDAATRTKKRQKKRRPRFPKVRWHWVADCDDHTHAARTECAIIAQLLWLCMLQGL